MDIDSLFDLISKEDVTLFVGAGLSCSVGLPSGSELAAEVYKRLPKDIQESITGDEANLAKVSSAYIHHFGIDSRNELINFIQQYFDFRYPQDISLFPVSNLVRLFHFKTIITTNYDNILEKCYGDKCVVVASNNDVPKAGQKRDKIILIKTHGDFNNRSEMILTQDDYNNLYTSNMDTPLWNLVKSELSTKNILFLGYGYNDGNIDALLSYIESKIPKKKDVFLVSQTIPAHKKNELNAKGIHYFEENIDEFLHRLIARFNETIVTDFNSKKISYETLFQFTNSKFTPVVEGDTFKYPIPSSDFLPSLKFTSGVESYTHLMDMDNFDPIEIKDVKNFKFTIGDIGIPFGEIEQITIQRSPTQEFRTTVYFFDTDFEVVGIPTKEFIGKNVMKFIAQLPGGEVHFEVKLNQQSNNASFYCTPNDIMSIKTEIEWLTLMENLSNGKAFRLTTDAGLNITKQFPFTPQFEKGVNFSSRLEYLKKLRTIEKNYGIVFTSPIEPTKRDIRNVDIISRNINGNLIEAEGDISVRAYLTTKDNGSSLMTYEDTKFMFIEKEYVTLNLHGQQINLGYKMFEAIDPEYVEDGHNKKKEVELKVRKGNYKAIYQPLPPDSLLKKE